MLLSEPLPGLVPGKVPLRSISTTISGYSTLKSACMCRASTHSALALHMRTCGTRTLARVRVAGCAGKRRTHKAPMSSPTSNTPLASSGQIQVRRLLEVTHQPKLSTRCFVSICFHAPEVSFTLNFCWLMLACRGKEESDRRARVHTQASGSHPHERRDGSHEAAVAVRCLLVGQRGVAPLLRRRVLDARSRQDVRHPAARALLVRRFFRRVAARAAAVGGFTPFDALLRLSHCFLAVAPVGACSTGRAVARRFTCATGFSAKNSRFTGRAFK